jgi:hypothetical protein
MKQSIIRTKLVLALALANEAQIAPRKAIDLAEANFLNARKGGSPADLAKADADLQEAMEAFAEANMKWLLARADLQAFEDKETRSLN